MRRLFPLLPVLFASAVIIGACCTTLYWQPTDVVAAWGWNLAIILAPALALLAQWKAIRERQMSAVMSMTVLAILNTSIVLGSRLGAWKGTDWIRALQGDGLPDLPGKTVMGGLLLMLLVYFLLKRWWRIPAGMADVLMLGLPLAAVSGRVGCLLAGCCYGTPTDSDWGICYGPGTPAYTHEIQTGLLSEAADHTLLLFPIQLFFIAGNLLIFTVLWHFRKKLTRPGGLAFLSISLLTAQRFSLEFIRDIATNRGSFGILWNGIKMGQWVVLLIALGSLLGFLIVQYFPKKSASVQTASIGIAPQAYALGLITLGSFFLRDLLTLDETMVILISCTPAVILLGRNLWRERVSGRSVLAPASMLSATAVILLINPADTLPIKAYPGEWKQWMELSAGGRFGSYKQISRDCDGDVIDTDIIHTKAGGGEISANWQRDRTILQVGLRGAFGNAHTDENTAESDNYRYSSFGVNGSAQWKGIGLSLGAFNRRQIYPPKVGSITSNEMQFAGSLRLGRLDRYFLDFRYYDELVLGFSNEPPFSIGLLNWGFDDPSGNSRIRAGLAVTSAGETAFQAAGQFPLGSNGLYGSVSTYLGNANMLSFGLRYRCGNRSR